jgi:hypothetical protein
MASTITDGTTTITFTTFQELDFAFKHESPRIYPRQQGKGQIISTRGKISKIYTFGFTIKSVVGGDTAFTQLETIESFFETKHVTYGYQRKLTFNKPGGGTKNLNGVILDIAGKIIAATDERKIIGTFVFGIDNLSKQVP